jgi:hypothetical protein
MIKKKNLPSHGGMIEGSAFLISLACHDGSEERQPRYEFCLEDAGSYVPFEHYPRDCISPTIFCMTYHISIAILKYPRSS